MALGPPRRSVPLHQGTPVQDLVQNLIGISNQREQEARRKRLEERQARLDAMNAEEVARQQQLKDFEVGQQAELLKVLPDLIKSSAEAQSMLTAEPGAVPSEQAKAIMKTGPDGQKETRFEGPVPEVLDQMKAGFKGRELMSNEPVDTLDQTLPVTPQRTPDAIPLAPTSPAPEVAPHQQPYERGYGDLNLFGIDEPVPFQNREEALARMQEENMLSSSVLSALARVSGGRQGPAEDKIMMDVVLRETGERVLRPRSEVRENPDLYLPYDKPSSASSKPEKWGMYWNQLEGRSEYISESQLRANPEVYRKIYAADVKKDKRGGSVMEIFGGPNSNDPASLWNAATAMNEGKTGGLGRMTGAIGTAYRSFMGEEPLTRNYQKQLAGFSSMIAKEFGEAGRLSDQDIQRTMNLFPTPGDTEEETAISLGLIWKVIRYGQGRAERPVDVLGETDETHTFSVLNTEGTDEEPPDAR